MLLQTLSGKWQFRQTQTEDWLPAQVPGSVHTDLLTLGRIPDPFVGDNEKKVMWVAEQDWEYRRTFTVDPSLLAEEKVFLVCDGLDTLAEVRLNGQLLGKTENLFRRYEWEIKAQLQPGQNEIRSIPAGRTARVICPLPDGWSLAQTKGALRLYSLYNSFT